MTRELSKRLKDFCKYKAQGYSTPEAAVKAGYSETYADTQSHKLLGNPKVVELIEKLKAKVQKVAEEKFCYTVEQSFKNLKRMQEMALETDDKGRYQNLQAAIKAEELMGKMYGCYEADNRQRAINHEPVRIEILKADGDK